MLPVPPLGAAQLLISEPESVGLAGLLKSMARKSPYWSVIVLGPAPD